MPESDDIEFWPIRRVIVVTGLSRSEIYRRQKDDPGFPKARSYKNSTRRFWLSSDIRQWQATELTDVDGLIG